MNKKMNTVVLQVAGLHWASSSQLAEKTLGRRPGVVAVEVNPVAQTANVTYDPDATTVQQLRAWVTECGFHCAGQSVPQHICHPSDEPHASHSIRHVLQRMPGRTAHTVALLLRPLPCCVRA